MAQLLQLKNVTYSYSDELASETVIKGINLEIEKGSFVAVLGHNGSGKSTLAKLLNGLIIPTSGDVIVNGMNTRNEVYDKEIKRTVGMVFQNPDNQIVATIVDEDVAFGLENLGIDYFEMHTRVDEALKTVKMSDYKYHAPHNLSGGQKQRIAIAGILAMKPECIVLDEPTSMLDPSGRQDVINTIISLCREHGVTVVLITHFMDEAVLADRIVVMNKGNVVLDGTPDDVFSKVNEIKNIGLEVPASKELICMLEDDGFILNSKSIDEDENVSLIVDFLGGKSNV